MKKSHILYLLIWIPFLLLSVNTKSLLDSSGGIIDIGRIDAPTEIEVPFEWLDSMPTLTEVPRDFIYDARDYDTPIDCEYIPGSKPLCPVKKTVCDTTNQYKDGNSTEHDATTTCKTPSNPKFKCDGNYHEFAMSSYINMSSWNPSGQTSSWTYDTPSKTVTFKTGLRYKCSTISSVRFEQLHQTSGAKNHTSWVPIYLSLDMSSAETNPSFDTGRIKNPENGWSKAYYYVPNKAWPNYDNALRYIYMDGNYVTISRVGNQLHFKVENTYDGMGWTTRDVIEGNLALTKPPSVKCSETYKTDISLGLIGDNYWNAWPGGGCKFFSHTGTFTINDLAKINSFKLKRTKFDDYIAVIINGNIVHVGPFGGDMLAIQGTGEYAPVQYNSSPVKKNVCELRTDWAQTHNIDITPYLVQGTNTFEIKVAVGDRGEGYANFEVEYDDASTFACASGQCTTIATSITGRKPINYKYYTYTCEQNLSDDPRFSWVPKNPGGNCEEDDLKPYVDPDDGLTKYRCNDPKSPPKNCKKTMYICPFDSKIDCQLGTAGDASTPSVFNTVNTFHPTLRIIPKTDLVDNVCINGICYSDEDHNKVPDTSDIITKDFDIEYRILRSTLILIDPLTNQYAIGVPTWTSWTNSKTKDKVQEYKTPPNPPFPRQSLFIEDIEIRGIKRDPKDPKPKVVSCVHESNVVKQIDKNVTISCNLVPTGDTIFDINISYNNIPAKGKMGVRANPASVYEYIHDGLGKIEVTNTVLEDLMLSDLEIEIDVCPSGYIFQKNITYNNIYTRVCSGDTFCNTPKDKLLECIDTGKGLDHGITQLNPNGCKSWQGAKNYGSQGCQITCQGAQKLDTGVCIKKLPCPDGYVDYNVSHCKKDYTFDNYLCDGKTKEDMAWNPGDRGPMSTAQYARFPGNKFFCGMPIYETRNILKSTFVGSYKTDEYDKYHLKPIDTFCSDNNKDCQFRLVNIHDEDNGKSLCFRDAINQKGCFSFVDKSGLPGDPNRYEDDQNCTWDVNITHDAGITALETNYYINVPGLSIIDVFTGANGYRQWIGVIISTCPVYAKVGHLYSTRHPNPIYQNSPIISAKADRSKIRFSDSYKRGDIGFIEVIPEIKPKDLEDGFHFPNTHVVNLAKKGFKHFDKLVTNKHTILFAGYNSPISKADCESLISDTPWYIAQASTPEEQRIITSVGLYGHPSNYNYNDGYTALGSCVVAKIHGSTFNDIGWASKVKVSNQKTQYMCSPLLCGDGQCQTVSCPANTVGTKLKKQEKHEANITDACTDQVCDRYQSFMPMCGKDARCETDKPEIFEVYEDDKEFKIGTCVEASCTDPAQLDPNTGHCKEWGCRDSVKVGDKCIKTLY